jgi:hypothetical protein
MALATGFMKDLYGVLGESAIVHRGNKVFLRKRPGKSTKPPTELAQSKKARFGLAGKIAGKISSINEIKQFWKGDPVKNNTGYNRLFQANHCQFNIEDFSGKIVLSEGYGLEVVNPLIELGETGPVIKCDSFESADAGKEAAAKYIRATGIIVMKNPGAKDAPEYDFMIFMTKEIPKIKEEKFSAEVKYLGGDFVKFQDYAVKKAFAVFITCNEEWELTDISKTVESDLSDNSGGVGGEGAENAGNEVSETNGNILEG